MGQLFYGTEYHHCVFYLLFTKVLLMQFVR